MRRPMAMANGRLCVAAASSSGVDVERGVSAGALGADVGDVHRRVERQAPLERDVPGLDVAAVDVARLRRVHRRAAISGTRPVLWSGPTIVGMPCASVA